MTLKRPVRRVVPGLLRWRAVSEVLNLDGILHSVRLLLSQIIGVACTGRTKRFVLQYRGGDDGGRALHIEPLHPVVFAELRGCAVGRHVEEERKEGGKTARETRISHVSASELQRSSERDGGCIIFGVYVQAGDSESGAGFVKPADGDAGFGLPVGDEAAVAERPA